MKITTIIINVTMVQFRQNHFQTKKLKAVPMKRFTLSKLALATLVATTSQISFAATNNTPDENDIETIIVTGQKIVRSLQETKESVSVITSDAIAHMPVVQFSDLLDITPNAFTLGGGESFGLRGISQNSASTGGGDGALGTLYIDNVAYTGYSTRFNPKDLWDVEQVEILRGPQSTNVGRNALVGAMVVKTKSPELDLNYASVKLELGTFGSQTGSGMANIAITDNSALRISAQMYKTDGYINNVTLDDDEFDARENTNIRAQYYVEFNEDFNANLTLGHASTKRGQDIYRADLQPEDSFTSSANIAAKEDYDATTGSLALDYQISQHFNLTAITSFLDGDYSRIDDDDEGPEGGNAYRGREAQDKNWAQELRLTFNSDKLQGVVGLYYTEVELINDTRGLINILPAEVGVPATLLPFYPSVLEINRQNPFEQQTTNYAFFTEWDYKLFDNLTLSAGFRYDNESQDSLSNSTNTLAVGSELPDPVEAGQMADFLFPGADLGPVVQGGVTQVNALLSSQLSATNFPERNAEYDAFLPQIGVTYDINEDMSLSAFYKKGYRAGGAELTLVGDQNEYAPEYLDNFEIAYRSMWLQGDLTFNANAYYGDWTDQQVTQCDPNNVFDCVTVNAGESEIYGLEAELHYSVSDDFSVFASTGYAHNEFTKFFSPSEGDLSGKDFVYSPDLTAAIGTRVYLTEAFYLSGNINYQDSMWADFSNTTKLNARTLVNLKAGYEGESFSIDAYVTNLTDKFYLQMNSAGNGDSRFVRGGAPRQVGVSVTYHFE